MQEPSGQRTPPDGQAGAKSQVDANREQAPVLGQGTKPRGQVEGAVVPTLEHEIAPGDEIGIVPAVLAKQRPPGKSVKALQKGVFRHVLVQDATSPSSVTL